MSRRSRERRPARRPAYLQPRKRFLVVCEGERTEPEYLRGLNKHFSEAVVEIDFAHKQAVSIAAVQMAIELRDRAGEMARRTGDGFHAYDQVWCAFDIDDHHHVHDAKQLAKARGIELAISNPCIELWLLLHFRDNPGQHHRDHLQSMMRKYVSGYGKNNKGVSFDAYLPGYEEAVQRAQRIAREAEEQGEEGRNPSTSIWKLTQALRHS